jgi:ADP-L-glycero-D-manno-heptose 6-epimerase
MFASMNRPARIEYVDMPESIRGQYQYFTQSNVGRLRAAGYNAGFTSLEDSVRRYVTGFLDRPDRYR